MNYGGERYAIDIRIAFLINYKILDWMEGWIRYFLKKIFFKF